MAWDAGWVASWSGRLGALAHVQHAAGVSHPASLPPPAAVSRLPGCPAWQAALRERGAKELPALTAPPAGEVKEEAKVPAFKLRCADRAKSRVSRCRCCCQCSGFVVHVGAAGVWAVGLSVRYGQGTQRAGCAATAVLANRLLLLLLRAAGQSPTMTPQLQCTDVVCNISLPHVSWWLLTCSTDLTPLRHCSGAPEKVVVEAPEGVPAPAPAAPGALVWQRAGWVWFGMPWRLA